MGIRFNELKNIQSPFLNKARINKVGGFINLARDFFIVSAILNKLGAGKNVLAVFGANHVVAQEKVLKEYFKNKEKKPRFYPGQNQTFIFQKERGNNAWNVCLLA